MDWTEVKITVDAAQADAAGDIAQMTVPYGIYIEDYSHLQEEVEQIAHIDLIDEDLLKKDRSKAVVHVYIAPEDSPAEAIAFLRERYAASGIKYGIETASCAQEDWINNWKQYFHPIPVGKRLLIRPDWEQAENPEGRVVLDLEPGIAFGTGTHETTRLCMEFLEESVVPGCSMLDVGCGSGILSVAGLLLGAERAVGVDIDPLAVKTAVQNAERNHVENRFTGICGSLTDRVEGKFQVVAANIVADVILELLKDIGNFMVPDSILILSGIIDEREQDVLDGLKNSFAVVGRKEEKGWVALAVRQTADR
ncbi:50S ribosomal protein L11 methyltransferase [Caproiciproducens sp. NJN-50]|uniref:50S ribosomal protein L11 methyltransferase n=1 Tax=Acutalibacteraceae TaxID=3082771 RepID=UPI000FFE0578|nr:MULTISPECIES: 50S ribosomal protein L11 methyltransferase [Acutalibacteraceae]QAT50866.1 50S ribosomal protein L11 methyltransferase [Caproiciproducens sp. NJN-50]